MSSTKSKKESFTFDGFVDLDTDKIKVGGKRLTEARAEALGKEISRKFKGRPSLSSKNEISPLVQFRISKAKKLAIKKKAKSKRITESELMRLAVDLVLADK